MAGPEETGGPRGATLREISTHPPRRANAKSLGRPHVCHCESVSRFAAGIGKKPSYGVWVPCLRLRKRAHAPHSACLRERRHGTRSGRLFLRSRSAASRLVSGRNQATESGCHAYACVSMPTRRTAHVYASVDMAPGDCPGPGRTTSTRSGDARCCVSTAAGRLFCDEA